MIYLLILALLIFIAAYIYFLSTKKFTDPELDKYKNANERFLKAVQFKDNPERIVGFYEIDQVTELSVTQDYAILKALCMELVEKGFNVSDYAVIDNFLNIQAATVHVFSKVDENKIGSITIFPFSNSNKTKLDDFFLKQHIENRKVDSLLHHLILRLPGLVIESQASLKEAIRPPVWMFVVSQVLAKYNPMYIDPDWIQSHPDAKRYINTLFEDEEP